MTIDQAGIDFITHWEGCKLIPYQDVVGKLTVGVGHLIKPGEDFTGGITQAQADALLMSDVSLVESTLNSLVPEECTQSQWNALCSFGFNLGVGSLKTMLGHGWDQVPEQVIRWNKAGGVPVAGLTARRAAERDLFLL